MDFELTSPVPKRRNRKVEGAVLVEVLKATKGHPRVAWVARMNSGAGQINGRFIRFGFKGLSDLLGQLKTGEILAVECKAPGGRVSEEQIVFLELVRAFGGCAFIAKSAKDVFAELAAFTGDIN